MSAPPVRIRVGASLEASVAQTFRSAIALAGQAEKTIQRGKRETSKIAEDEAKRELRAQERAVRAAEQLDRQRARGLFQQYRQQEAAAEHAAKTEQRARERTEATARREIEKTVQAAVRAFEREERAQQRSQSRAGESFARRTSHRATRFLSGNSPLVPMAGRALRDVAQGVGIDFSVAGSVGRVADLEQQSRDLSNSGYQAGVTGANGKRVDPTELVKQARSVGGQFGINASDVLGGLEQYQKIAGDLDTGRQSLFRMAELAKATKTSLTDMAAATANVSNGLGDIPNKAEVIDDVMRTIAGQGKLGAVEISDMATQMARIAAAAGNFGGDRGKNIREFGALAQIARSEGGAPSAAEAARSMGGFANTLKKGARIEAFKKEGIDVFTDKTRTQLKDPVELIKESLLTTGGDLVKMNKLFMDVVGARTVGGLQKTFVGAGGGQAGLSKVDEQIQRMLKAQMSRQEVSESARLAGETTASKAARFQNEWDQVTEGVMAKLVPALEQSEPALLRFAKVVGDVASWTVQNPKTAIATAISASIARAGLESALRSGIERLLLGPNGVNASKLGNVAGQVGGALTIAAIAVTTLTVGMAVIDQWYASAQQAQKQAVETDISGTNAGNEAMRLAQGGDLKGAKAKAEDAVKLKEAALKQTSETGPGTFGKLFEGLIRYQTLGKVDPGKERDESIKRATEQQNRELQQSRDVLNSILEAIKAQGGGDGTDTGTDGAGRVSQ